MDLYNQLLLRTGGGIVASVQQARQADQTADIFIGLGGTGIDAIRTIKSQVRSCIQPDWMDSSEPVYDHIRFLGVDTDTGPKPVSGSYPQNPGQWMELEEAECFDIALMGSPDDPESFLKLKEEDPSDEYRISRAELEKEGTKGIRPAGRFLFRRRADRFRIILRKIIQEVLADQPEARLNIHFFTSLCGGTGSGCLLDVCSIARELTEDLKEARLFGYFFLPDVSLSRIPSESGIRNFLMKNARDAMQELDSGLHGQEKDRPPVDLAYLISAGDSHGKSVPGGYGRAMNTAADYVMNCMIHPSGDESDSSGSDPYYITIGASTLRLPLKEMNTYLACQVYRTFSRTLENSASPEEARQFVLSALDAEDESESKLYDSLLNRLRKEPQNGDEPERIRQTDRGVWRGRIMERNLIGMESSILHRIYEHLLATAADDQKGPGFVLDLLNRHQKVSLFSVLDDLMETNRQVRFFLDPYTSQLMTELLYYLEDQLEYLADEYRRLYDVMDKLKDTLEENENDLNSPSFYTNDADGQLLVPMESLRPCLDTIVQNTDLSEAFQGFIRFLFNHYDAWFEEAKKKIAGLICTFFTEQLFPDFTRQSGDILWHDMTGQEQNPPASVGRPEDLKSRVISLLSDRTSLKKSIYVPEKWIPAFKEKTGLQETDSVKVFPSGWNDRIVIITRDGPAERSGPVPGTF